MAVLTDIIIASTNDVPAIVADWPGEKRWPAFETSGLEYLLLSELAVALQRATLAHTIETLDPTVSVSETDGPWLYVVPTELRDLIAEVPPCEIGAVARRWSEGEEAVDRGLSHEDAERLILAIQKLAVKARGEGKPMLLWVSM